MAIDPSRIKTLFDLGYTIVAEPPHPEYGTHVVDYKIYEIFECWDENGNQRECWHNSDSNPVDNIEEAEVVMSGSVKWDGCSNWTFDCTERNECLHACDRKGLLNVGKVLAAAWEWTAELCPRWDHEMNKD